MSLYHVHSKSKRMRRLLQSQPLFPAAMMLITSVLLSFVVQMPVRYAPLSLARLV